MLTKKQIRLLELLDNQLLSCKDCELWTGGTSKPYWTPKSKYGLIGEAPGYHEVNNEPFVGTAGRLLWVHMEMFGLKKESFVIINTTNCRPLNKRGTNGNPTKDQCEMCYPYMRKYLHIVKPSKIILLGNFATGVLTGEYTGIMKKNAKVLWSSNFNAHIILSIHPSSCLYNSNNKLMLKHSLKTFKEL